MSEERKFVVKKDAKSDVITYMEYEKLKGFNVKPKKRRVGRYTGLTNRTKKAIVTLAEGQSIELN